MMSRQKELPKLPLTPLQEALDRFVERMEPLLTDQELAETRKVVRDFGKASGDGQKLYQLLQTKASSSDNIISDWIVEYAFLKFRGSVISKSPGMAFARQNFTTSSEQLEHAARLTAAALNFKYLIDRNLLKPDVLGTTPLDMTQYKNIFGSCRVPLVGGDKLEFTSLNDESSKNVLIINNNQFFVFNAHDERGVPFDEGTILALLLRVTDMSREDGTPIGILTTDERDAWAKAHERLCQNPRNAASLQAIRKAALAVCLDRKLHNSEPYEVTSGQQLFAGGQDGENAANRWWDKTIQLVVGKEGLTGFLFEHSSIDATMGAALADYCMAYIADSGPVVTPKEATKVDIIKLEFNIEPETLEDIATAKSNQARFRANSDKLFFKFTKYGKNSVKSWKLSPDSYVQMALQLACYKVFCRPTMMNENLSTRKFLRGRTEGVYSISKDSASFCKIFEDPHASMEEKRDSLRKAVESHKQEANLASNGRGLIRLFTLLGTTAVENGIPLHDFFTGAAYQTSRHVTLVTSQVSTECDSATFFEPFVSDGYAIFYNVQSDSLTFAISSCKSCPETSSAKFKEALEKSLIQMEDCVVWSDRKV